MSTDDYPSSEQQSTEDAGSEANTPTGAGAGFLSAPTPVDDAPVSVIASGIAAYDDDDPDVLEPTQIMPPVTTRPGAEAYGRLGPAPGPHNPDQPWGPGSPEGDHPIPGPQYGQAPQFDPTAPYDQPPGQPYPGGVPPYGPGAEHENEAENGGGKRRLLVTGGLVVALAVVGVGTFTGVRALTTGSHHSTPPPPAQQKPSAAPSKAAPPEGGIDSADTDAKEMTAAEAFPDESVTAGGTTFNQVRATVLDECKDAAKGAFVKALRAGGCQRVIDATFVDKDKKYAVTAGVAALPTKDDATRAEKAADSKKDSWFAALAGKKGSGAEKIEKSGGYAGSLVWGRYIVFSYASYSDGHMPKADDTKLTRLSQEFRTTATKAIAARAAS